MDCRATATQSLMLDFNGMVKFFTGTDIKYNSKLVESYAIWKQTKEIPFAMWNLDIFR